MLIFGLIVALLLSFGMYRHEQRSWQRDFERRALIRVDAVEIGINNAIDALQVVHQAVAMEGGSVSREQFHAFTQALHARHPSIRAFGFERLMAGGERSAFEARMDWRYPGSGLHDMPAGKRVVAAVTATESELAYASPDAPPGQPPGPKPGPGPGPGPGQFSRNFGLAGSAWHIVIAAPATPFLAAHGGALLCLLAGVLTTFAATAYVQANALRTRRIEQLVALRTGELKKVNQLLIRDIKARALLEQALLASEERSREFAELSSDLFWEQDEQCRYTNVSTEPISKDAVAAPFKHGLTRWEVGVDPDASDWTAHRAALEAHQPFKDFEFKTLSRDPAEVLIQWFSSSGKPLFDAQGRFKGYRGTSRDISDRKRAEAALLQSRKALHQLADHQESVREDERKRIARHIHDELGQNLMAHRLDVSMMATQFDSVALSRERIHTALRHIDTTIKAVRAIINDLRPAVLDLGLHAAVEWQAGEFERRSGIACELHIDHEEFVLDDKHATALFRIVQESLTNILRHARARHVQIEMQRRDGGLFVKIADQGIGLPADWRRKANAFGLVGIEERIYALGGTFSIVSHPGRGMAIIVSIPLGSGPERAVAA